MSFFKTPPIPLLEAGPERELMARILERVKRTKGLTTALVQTAGVNNQWLKPDEPYNYSVKRLLRIVLHTMHFLGRDECKQKANTFIDYVFEHILPSYAKRLTGEESQEPPWLRRLYRRRYHFFYQPSESKQKKDDLEP